MKKFFVSLIVIAAIAAMIGCGRHHRHNYKYFDGTGNNFATAVELVLGYPVTGYVDGTDDVDWYCLDLVEGQRYCFDTSNLSFGLGTTLTLVDETGLGVVTVGQSKLCFSADYTGKHYLIVSFNGVDVGTYDLVVNNCKNHDHHYHDHSGHKDCDDDCSDDDCGDDGDDGDDD